MTKNIIGVSGKKRHGKNATGDIVRKLRPNTVMIAYADALKLEVASMIAEYRKSQWYRASDVTEDNEAIRQTFVQSLIQEMNDDSIDPQTGVAVKEKYRLILQWWGTEFRRQMFRDSYWRDKLVEKIQGLPDDTLVVVTDVRFPDEADQIKELGGILVRVNRPGLPDTGAHSSETALDDYGFAFEPGFTFTSKGEVMVTETSIVATPNNWDVVITNDGSLEDLEAKVKEVLTTYGY